MKQLKNALFLATVASSAVISSGAQAQTTATNDGGQQLHGAGSTSIQEVLVQELNCMDDSQRLGQLPSTTLGIAEPTDLPTPSGSFNCSTQALGAGFVAQYIGAGSNTGRQAWRSAGTVGFGPIPTARNPFGAWTKVQFAFSDSLVTDDELNAYISPSYSNSFVDGGAPIMIPKFILPVALAYAPVYGRKGTTDYRFNVNPAAGNNAQTSILGTPVGGLRLSRATFCGIVNGTIRNFNAASFTADNGGVDLRDPADSATRWARDGVPVRLVGRVDKSGTTDIFTRAISTQCGPTNYLRHAETLPYLRMPGFPDFSGVSANTALSPTSRDANASTGYFGADSANLVGNTFYDAHYDTYVTVPGNAVVSANPPTGSNDGTGLFLVAEGSIGVAYAIKKAPDVASLSDLSFMLNGKIGYISASYLNGSPTGAGLFAAAIENPNLGTGSAYVLPTANTATAAFSGIRPPQTGRAGGAYSATDAGIPYARNTSIPSFLGGGTGLAKRDNPWAWYNVMYMGDQSDSYNRLDDPLAGYPVTGTTQVLLYTCYKVDAGGDNAAAIRNWLGWNYDVAPATDTSGATRTGIFTKGPQNNFVNTGLLARSNIGNLGNQWEKAIRETFLDQTDPTGLNLYIRNSSATGCAGVHSGM